MSTDYHLACCTEARVLSECCSSDSVVIEQIFDIEIIYRNHRKVSLGISKNCVKSNLAFQYNESYKNQMIGS